MSNERIDLIAEEQNEEFSNDDLFNITSWGADPSVRELILQYKEGDIEKPELQRKYVWKKKDASRFIESLLLGLPVPSIFLANIEQTGKRLIIDGYQRIHTLYDYIEEEIWHGDNSEFKLVDSELINERWRGKSFRELPETDKRRLKNYTIHAIVFEQKHPSDDSGLFQVFERINTSGTTLNNQEIRNCVYQGDMNTLLFKANKNQQWRILYGEQEEDSRMLDLELILRYYALNTPDIYNSERKKISLKQELNKYMQLNMTVSPEFIAEKELEFCSVIDFIYTHMGEEAFFNLQNDLSKIRRRLNPTVFDSIMIATSIAQKRGYVGQEDNLSDKRLELLKDATYRDSISQGTMKTDNIRIRISYALRYLYGMEL